MDATNLSAQEFWAFSTPQRVSVPVPEIVPGKTFQLAAFGATVGFAISKKCRTLPRDEEGGLTPEGMVAFYVEVIACSAIDEGGERYLDSAEGRHQLTKLGVNVLRRLGQAALDLNAMGGESVRAVEKN
jgi:hypothetical protein